MSKRKRNKKRASETPQEPEVGYRGYLLMVSDDGLHWTACHTVSDFRAASSFASNVAEDYVLLVGPLRHRFKWAGEQIFRPENSWSDTGK